MRAVLKYVGLGLLFAIRVSLAIAITAVIGLIWLIAQFWDLPLPLLKNLWSWAMKGSEPYRTSCDGPAGAARGRV